MLRIDSGHCRLLLCSATLPAPCDVGPAHDLTAINVCVLLINTGIGETQKHSDIKLGSPTGFTYQYDVK